MALSKGKSKLFFDEKQKGKKKMLPFPTIDRSRRGEKKRRHCFGPVCVEGGGERKGGMMPIDSPAGFSKGEKKGKKGECPRLILLSRLLRGGVRANPLLYRVWGRGRGTLRFPRPGRGGGVKRVLSTIFVLFCSKGGRKGGEGAQKKKKKRARKKEKKGKAWCGPPL